MKKINFILIAFVLFLISFQGYGLGLGLIFLVIYGKKGHWYEYLLIVFLLFRLFIPVSNEITKEAIIQGKVSSISSNSFILNSKNRKYQVITQEKVMLDDEIQVQIEPFDNQDSSHFYSFDYSKYQKEKGICATVYGNKLEVIKRGKTLRSFIHRKILLQDEAVQDLMLKLLLNQNGTDLSLLQCGFHYFWLIHFIERLLLYFIDERQAQGIKRLLMLFLLVLLHFPYSLIRNCLLEFLRNRYDKKTILAFYTILLYLINPYLLHSIGYIIPMGLLLLNSNREKRILFLVVMQSYYFYECSWIKLFFFSFFNRLNGFLSLVCFYDLFLNQTLISRLYPWIVKLDELCNTACLKGVGKLPTVFIFFCLYILYAKDNRKPVFISLSLSFLLLQFNLTAPFAEVSFINVKQGDAIFIHLPLGQGTILIDTGKASSYQHLKAFLKAKGVKKIDYLIITHEDSDHAGAKEKLIADFEVNTVLDEYCQPLQLHQFTLVFLSPQRDYGNSNDNSLVSAFSLNGLDFLLLADISSEVEKELCLQYKEKSFDFVKLAHHGSKSSTSLSLLKHFDFRYAIISSGVNNSYHHPSDEVLDRLKAFAIPVLNTQNQGDITITMTTFCNFILTSNQEFVIMKKVVKE